MARQVASLFGVLTLRDNDYREKLQQNRNETTSFSQQLTSMGGQMQSFAGNMAAVASPIALGLGVSVNASRNFASEMANVNSIVQMGSEDAAAMRAEVLALGSQNTFGPIGSAGALYSIVSAGITDTNTAMAVLNSSVNAAEAGQADLNATTAGMISLMNSYNLGADGATFASDILARTVQTGVGTMNDFATALPQVTGLSSQFGIGLDEVAGSMSYMTTQGFSASQSATFLRAMITTLLNPTTDLATVINSLGYESGQALLESEGLFGSYAAISEVNQGLAGLITNQEALTGSLILTNEQGGQAIASFTNGIDGATAAMGAAQAEAQIWDRLRSTLQGLSVTVGNALAPVLLTLVENMIPVITQVTDWITQNPQLATTVLMVAAGVAVAVPVIGMVGTLLTAAGAAAGLFGGALAILFSPIGLVIGGIALLIAWLNGREGGIIGSLNEARIVAQQLAILGIIFLNGAVNALRNTFQLLGIDIDGVIEKVHTFLAIDVSQDNRRSAFGQNIGQEGFNPVAFLMGGRAGQASEERGNQGSVLGFLMGGRANGNNSRAMGGPVSGGRSYLVGEKGPEIFTPSGAGNITPNNSLGSASAGTTMTINLTVNANSAEGGRAAGRAAFSEVLDLARSQGITVGQG